jgi:hypothetical protein
MGFGQALGAVTPGCARPTSGPASPGSGRAAVFVPLALLAVLGAGVFGRGLFPGSASAPRRAAVPWLCGYAREAECNRYVAHGYYGEIKRYFRWLGGAPTTQKESSPNPNPNPK